MHILLQRLILDHKRLIILLEILARQLDDFHAGNEHDLDLACELVQYIRAYADQVHHPTEDLIFVRFKALSDENRAVLEVLDTQHQMLATMTKNFSHALESVMQGDVMPRDLIEEQGRAMVKLLKEHIDLEEREAFTCIDTCLKADDWQVLEAQIPNSDDPVFERPDPIRFRSLLRHLAQVRPAQEA